MVMCLGQGADLHMAQVMPLPLTISCSSKFRLVLPSWFYLSGAGSPGKSWTKSKVAIKRFSVCVLRITASYLSKVADFNLPHLHLAPAFGVTPYEFRRDLWHQKTRIPKLSCGIACMILNQFGTIVACDGQMDGRTDRYTTMVNTMLA